MQELIAFSNEVKRTLQKDEIPSLKLVPLFFKLTPADLKDQGLREIAKSPGEKTITTRRDCWKELVETGNT